MFLPVHNLWIGGIVTVDRLDKFHTTAKLGEHTILCYEGMVASQRAEELKKKLTTKESITIENQEGTHIFTGYPLKAVLRLLMLCRRTLQMFRIKETTTIVISPLATING